MSKIRDKGECAACGNVGKVTLEHVPPKCLFAKPRPTPLPIYTCEECNAGSSSQDEELKALIIATASLSSPQGRDLKPSFIRTIKRNKRLLRLIVEAKKGEDFIDPSTGEEMVKIAWNMNALHELYVKIASCLYYHSYGEILPRNISHDRPIYKATSEFGPKIPQMIEGSVGNDNEFSYRIVRVMEDGRTGYHCQMVFWKRIRIDVSARN